MTQYLNDEGVPLRGDGTPFPGERREWSDEEREYLEQYYFGGELETGIEDERVAVVDVPELTDGEEDGNVGNTASWAWRVIESNKPSASLASNTCNAVPDGVTDLNSLIGAHGPNSVGWWLRKENLYGIEVVDIAFDLRWEYGVRFWGAGAYISNCYLYVPRCNVLWGFTVDVNLHVHHPTNAGTETAPIARLPLTISGTVGSLVNSHSLQWDFVLYGNGSYETS